MISRIPKFTAAAVALLLLAGCAVNPVTGKKELSLLSTSQELALGEQQYPINQQQQGGQYNVDPSLQEYVNQVGQKLAKVSDQPQLPYEFVVLNNSVPNAWALPGGKIAVNRGLLVLLEDEAELAAVLGHEIVHAAARHSAAAMSQQTLLNAGLAVLGAATQESAYGDLIALGGQLGGSAYIARYSRSNESEADQYGMKYMAAAGYDPQGAVRLQRKFVELSKGKQASGLEALFASHPPSQARVNANIEHAKQLPSGGVTNRAAYQKAIASLKRDADAYQKYDEALAAVNNKQYSQALSLVRQAQQKQPKEAAFYALEGDLLARNKQYREAHSAYDAAVQKNPALFSHWLKRGIISAQLNDYSAAERDLNRSLNYLETPYAHYYLGQVYEKQGQVQNAYNHYQTAASAGGDIGSRAQARMQALSGQ
ncbi:M48 family metalloprotease [Microbulbifer thermotolerans]|uniref:M48 family metalloprotease n=1 Tax=Microbulbifer thermotolerans TaxID=252514 RepID=A0A143HQZ5_MICTH|nr:M48 family metalloprotease [Microbulbifer thermotolerans]AMX03887.1 peptidase M48 [Microbulbifer thermotolerans]MCX2778595.1 M48 family metalloprotease [Microbulbifer thermotolerans]MCX2782859.1 M48 family metalloprotease [Microbulbifer thermotolerans]MCX2794071.1 M48 family metalloprotease [Microbulbifer thermotolerans]MCX2802966.1 M48 family metalloprotease [Microbulbifer thermotolerans]